LNSLGSTEGRWGKGLQSIFAWVVSLVCLLAGVATIYHGVLGLSAADPSNSLKLLACGAVLLLVATIDRFEVLKAFGFEAQRRQLDDKLEEADRLLKKLHELSLLTGSALISVRAQIGRYGAPPLRESYDLVQQLRRMFEANETDASEVRKALLPWLKATLSDAAYHAYFEPLRLAYNAAMQASEAAHNERVRSGVEDASAWKQSLAEFEVELKKVASARAAGVEDYPRQLYTVLDGLELLSHEAAQQIRQNLDRLSPGMQSLRERYELEDPDTWFANLDALWTVVPGYR